VDSWLALAPAESVVSFLPLRSLGVFRRRENPREEPLEVGRAGGFDTTGATGIMKAEIREA
jgi:hypothetical protein